VHAQLGKDEIRPIRGIQKAMFTTMKKALEIPHFGYNEEVDITSLLSLRSQMRDAAAERGINFSYMPIFIKVCDLELKIFASIAPAQIYYGKYSKCFRFSIWTYKHKPEISCF
jgi:pyruvate/2-oxoglutarate dehydrogenase complex dihydrolipoamide acyltransferase (E2) component